MAAPVVDVVASQEEVPPPLPPAPGGRLRDDPRGWARANLFSSLGSALATVVFGLLLAYVAFRATRYVLFTGRWDVVRSGLTSIMVGLDYPRDTASLTRPWIAGYLGAVMGGVATGVARRRRAASWRSTVRPWVPIAIVGVVAVSLTGTIVPKLAALGAAAVLVAAAVVGARLPERLTRRQWVLHVALAITIALLLTGAQVNAWEKWGGFLLALYVSVLGIVFSFPFGVVLALGRRSNLPVARALSTIWIELIRGVPLITLLFAGDLALRFFFPPGAAVPGRVMRATIMVILFSSAYLAEIVRGGLQAVPAGQLEAARALSLGRFTTLRRIVLPQALRAVIPAIVGQFISLFKDTSLLTIIGLKELIGVADTVASQPEFRNQGLLPEILCFVGLLFWVCCYSMSKASQRLESRMGVGVR
jgi:general L-amino acid transport system permease protein